MGCQRGVIAIQLSAEAGLLVIFSQVTRPSAEAGSVFLEGSFWHYSVIC